VLVRDSAHFAALLETHDLGQTLHLPDEDVSSVAFVHFLTILLPWYVLFVSMNAGI
jgi:hypothetical protein